MSTPVAPFVGDDPASVTRRRFLTFALAAASVGAVSACGSQSPGAPSTTTGARPSPGGSTGGSTRSVGSSSVSPVVTAQPLRGNGSRRSISAADTAAAGPALAGFGVDFFRALWSGEHAANAAISPYSLFTVLAMARAGAKGATGTQIDTVLKAAGDGQGAALTAVDAAVSEAVAAAAQQDAPMIIESADQTWVERTYAVNQDYLDTLAVQFGNQAVAADFFSDPEGMRAAINSWVAKRTRNLIPELIPAGAIGMDTRLVLVNALYLKASWASEFTTRVAGTFTTLAGATVQAGMMAAPDPVSMTRGKGWTAVTIPYSGDRLAMTLLVPDSGKFDAVLGAVDAAEMASATTGKTSCQLTMPAFSLKSVAPAKDIAKVLGIVDIFDAGKADLSGIGGPPHGLSASEFLHQCVVKVDEKGTEAAAATAMAMVESSAQVSTEALVVDRPFLFWIADTTTRAPLFLGAVTDPSADS